MCDCYKIGGPWIAEDPNCPVHGIEAQRAEEERERQEASTEERLAQLEAQMEVLGSVRKMAQTAADSGDQLGQRIIQALDNAKNSQ